MTYTLEILGYLFIFTGMGWRYSWRLMKSPPFTVPTRTKAQERWQKGLFWLGVGLWALSQWRRWVGI